MEAAARLSASSPEFSDGPEARHDLRRALLGLISAVLSHQSSELPAEVALDACLIPTKVDPAFEEKACQTELVAASQDGLTTSVATSTDE